MTIVSGNSISTVYLLDDTTATVTATIVASGPGPAALYAYGNGSNSWNITNSGTITGNGAINGVQLGDAINGVATGVVTNQTGGTISGANYGVQIFNLGDPGSTVQNQATATIYGGSHGVGFKNYGYVDNSGSITAGLASTGADVNLVLGGVVDNYSGGTIQGYTGVYLGLGGAVTNAGQIIALTASIASIGVSIAGGGTVSNSSGGTIQGYEGVVIAGGPGTVTNYGLIGGQTVSIAGIGVLLSGGGTLSNGSTGVIQGYEAVVISEAGTVTNAGLITASGAGYTVYLAQGGSLDNTGTIQGHSGVSLGTAGTVTNEALINATAGYGIRLQAGGVVGNTGTIQGTGGVYVGAGTASTVTNAGTIDGGGNDAVKFESGNASSMLIVDPGASFTGAISGGGGTIDLAAGDGGTLGGFGVNITNFSTLTFATNADWTVSASYNESSSGFGFMPITGFAPGDTIELTGVALNQASTYDAGGSGLYVNNGDGAGVYLNVQGGDYSVGAFVVTNNAGNTYIVDCFAAGTHIATLNGDMPIEDLAAGDLVNAHFSGTAPVKWIGRRHVDCTRHPDPRKVWPVRVAAGTFGPCQPSRDLTLSPNHAVYVNGDLIPISRLINGLSIVQVPVDEVTYYHVELAEHDLLLAEGLLAESYLDVGDRANFANGGEQLRLYPDFATTSPDVAAAWETRGCAPLILHGPRLEAVRSWLNEIALPQLLAAAA